MSIAFAPLSDITNVRRTQTNILASCAALSPSVGRSSCETTALSPEHLSPFPLQNPEVFSSVFTASSTVHVTRTTHNPYGWKCLPDNETQATILLAQRAHDAAHRATLRRIQLQVQAASANAAAAAAAATAAAAQAQAQNAIPRPTHEVSIPIMVPMTQSAQPNQPLRCLVQFKCHHAEYSSTILVEKGQYVAVQGDRGMDIGVVIRVNDGENKTFIERTGPCGSIMRHATQREVDYWASELKQDEANALEFCRRRCAAFDLQMEVRYAEFQYDKKKLTFYYDAKSRVNFVDLLKDLYREFGCRIWMEKVRPQNE